MRKRSNKQAFSLFAFQDIITGVTAIILLFTLLLVLELVTRKATQAANASSTETAQQLSELAANMNEVQTIDIDSLQQAPTQEQVLAIVRHGLLVLGLSVGILLMTLTQYGELTALQEAQAIIYN